MQQHAGPGWARGLLDLRRPIYRETLWVTAAQIATIAARLVAVKLLTTLLGDAPYGTLVLLLGIATLGVNAFSQPTQFAMAKYYQEAAAAGRVRSLRRIALGHLRKRVGLLVGLMGLVALGGALFAGADFPSLGLVAAAVLLSLDVRRALEVNLLNVARRQATYSLWTACDAWARALLAPLSVYLFARFAVPALAGEALAIGIVYLAFRRQSITGAAEPDEDPAWNQALRDRLLAYGRPMIGLALIGWITGLGDRYVLAWAGGPADAGQYAAAFGLGSLPFLALAAIGFTVFRPLLFDAVSRNDRSRERQILGAWCLVYGAIALLGGAVLVVAREPIVRLAIGPVFWDRAPALIPWIAVAFGVQGLQNVAEARLYAQGRTARVLGALTIGAAVSLAGYAAFVPRWGAIGAAATCLASRSICCIASWVLCMAPGDGRSGAGAASAVERQEAPEP